LSPQLRPHRGTKLDDVAPRLLPSEVGSDEIHWFFSHLVIDGRVAAARNQALCSLLFLYCNVLNVELPYVEGIERAKRPAWVPVVLNRRERRVRKTPLTVRWSEREARRPAAAYGKRFLTGIGRLNATRSSGRRTQRRCPHTAKHVAVGKESGETAQVERWNLRLQQRLARFVRRTFSFSKSEKMREACVRLCIHR
jgi:hypothetical protein